MELNPKIGLPKKIPKTKFVNDIFLNQISEMSLQDNSTQTNEPPRLIIPDPNPPIFHSILLKKQHNNTTVFTIKNPPNQPLYDNQKYFLIDFNRPLNLIKMQIGYFLKNEGSYPRNEPVKQHLVSSLPYIYRQIDEFHKNKNVEE